jgi:preprotein translocase subunit SecY
MKRFFTTIKNIFSIEDLRVRILNTVGFLIIFRLGSYIVLPGIDAVALELELASGATKGGILGLLDTFSGGSFSRVSLFALGIMPYISASIVIQLLTVAVPTFTKMQKEGESGRKKLNQYTRILTIAITAAQAYAYLRTQVPVNVIIDPGFFFTMSSVVIMIGSTMFCMWLGERITDKGIGNGISMLIMIGIVSRFPVAIQQEVGLKLESGGLILFIIELLVLFFVGSRCDCTNASCS